MELNIHKTMTAISELKVEIQDKTEEMDSLAGDLFDELERLKAEGMNY